MRTVGVLLVVSICAVVVAVAQNSPADSTSDIAAVRKVLDDQVAAWNRGDLRAYMHGYWNSPELTFFAGAKVTRGWQQTLDRYIAGYQTGGRQMGHLEFRNLEIQLLTPDTAFVRGQFHLKMKDGKQPHGLFTLLVKKLPEGWRVVHDHSSGE